MSAAAAAVLSKALAACRMSIILLVVPCLLWMPSAPGTRFAAARVPVRQRVADVEDDEDITLDWSDSNIAVVSPGMFTQYHTVTAINLAVNQISRLEAGTFAGPHTLKRLVLSSNHFESIEQGMFQGLSSLLELSLNHNAITRIAVSAFAGLSRLEELALNNNAIRSIAAGMFAGLTSLEVLYDQFTTVCDIRDVGH